MSKYILMATENPLSGNLDASFVQSGNVEVGNVTYKAPEINLTNVIELDSKTVNQYSHLLVDIAQNSESTGTYQTTVVVPVIPNIYEGHNDGLIIAIGQFAHYTVNGGHVELTKIDLCVLYDSTEGTLTVGEFSESPEDPIVPIDDIYISKVTGIK